MKVENEPVSEDLIFSAVFKYVESLFDIVQPKKLLYMAIDGLNNKKNKTKK